MKNDDEKYKVALAVTEIFFKQWQKILEEQKNPIDDLMQLYIDNLSVSEKLPPLQTSKTYVMAKAERSNLLKAISAYQETLEEILKE